MKDKDDREPPPGGQESYSGLEAVINRGTDPWCRGAPLTMEDVQRGMEKMKNASYKPQPRIVSYATYRRAEEALKRGASHGEVEWILAGGTSESYKEFLAEMQRLAERTKGDGT